MVRPFGSDMGVAHKMIVTARKFAEDEEIRRFFSQLAHDQRLLETTMDFAFGHHDLCEPEHLAADILGRDKVLGCREVHEAWQMK